MADDQEYRNAIARVAAGTGSQNDFYLTERMSSVAGEFGGSARAALKKAGKK